jgi:hypothetical protein
MKKIMLMLVLILIFTGCGREDRLNDKTKEKNTVNGVITAIKPEGILVDVNIKALHTGNVDLSNPAHTEAVSITIVH